MYTDSILNDYLESSQIDQSQLSDFLIMLETKKPVTWTRSLVCSYLMMMRAPLLMFYPNN
jgi:hypothetical protein